MHDVEETAAAFPASRNLEKIGMVCERDKAHTLVEHFNTEWVILHERNSGHITVKSELPGPPNSFYRFEARWKSGHEHGKATECHLTQIVQPPTVAHAKLAHEKSRLRTSEVGLRNAPDELADKNTLTANTGRFLDDSLQKCIADSFMRVLDHICAEEFVFPTNPSKHCIVIYTLGRAPQEDIRRFVTEMLDRDWSLPEFVTNDTSAVGASSGTSSDLGNSSGAGTSSGYPRTVR